MYHSQLVRSGIYQMCVENLQKIFHWIVVKLQSVLIQFKVLLCHLSVT